ncbi:MAG: molybdate ABC transporter substrate-binding protein [Chloroflexi bacterium]|nr:MAG: molybdate ABC transporter substrate-binding protein [Chloroflexota bacterium]
MSVWSCLVARALAVLIALFSLAACIGPHEDCALMACRQRPVGPLTVFAAASLQPAFDKIAAQIHVDATFNYAGTQTLTAQLTQGAEADVFASADKTQMKTLLDAGLIAGAPEVFAHNRLEIAVAKGNPKGIHSLADLARPGLVVVLADPSVPAGKYAQQALAKANVTVHPASLEPQVTGVLSKVALGEADAGIVYVSDVVTSQKVQGVPIPDSQNVVADYPIAALKNAQHNSNAAAFIAFVLAPDGQSILKAAGFEPA